MATDEDHARPAVSPAVRCADVRLRRGDTAVLDGLDLTVAAGRVHALLGRNGAGKSTTFRILLGLMQADSGTIEVLGESPSQSGRSTAALERIGASIDGPAIYERLSAFDHLLVHARLTGVGRARIEEVLDIVGLAGTGRKRARHFSMGMKARLALGTAILTEPELLILDEPQNGLDPQGIVELRHLLRDYAAAGRTVLVSSHQLGEIVQLADDISVLVDGRCRYQGTLTDFAPAGQLEQMFLDLTLPDAARPGAA
ncbi:ATP-binding cassette domain-containing protein [Actinoalloteichus hymeniacidonis]|uniref:ABC-type multidrug transport system, ATPase component n=1 Tax=Actinoalloteichus hymeniacidonis TaxID=340345 RepID=A0AAC9HMX2_9PSEU|nr:ATP-binding cassette domain-containing protein [Actinoalloteichus hymeniacidonis]AOS62213.1 ABC-type multidrug transport system, ATPase component [Actinoalloteichus hymeniacidonis]MBB5909762.1 ABC-2 type transport system ATP-binding protein [Actinoalloteichus hymeniacidonis]